MHRESSSLNQEMSPATMQHPSHSLQTSSLAVEAPMCISDSPKKQLSSHFTTIPVGKSELKTCTYLKPLGGKNSSGNAVTPERPPSQQLQMGRNETDTKYDFHSIPSFSQDLFISNWYGTTASTDAVGFGNSVVWIPQNREEWDRCSAELTGVCASAGLRRARILKRNSPSPMPEIYIRDRIDIDDPLRGFQIRHKSGGWLQGFILTTTFTTWTHFFKWDSRHPKSGMMPAPQPGQKTKWDDGTLSTELESQHRSGDPVGGGVVWSTIAEISLLSGLGCGKLLLHMAMEDIARQECYHFVVLQATEFSKPFYEKFGFKRVGCVTRYGKHPHLVGYRHWTYADEKNLVVHGGPSYMMAIRVKDFFQNNQKRLLDIVAKHTVAEKPKILPLTATPKPHINAEKRNCTSRKRKYDSKTENRFVRVVSYCIDPEKENEHENDACRKPCNNIDSTQIAKELKGNDNTETVWLGTASNAIEEGKKKTKTSRSRERVYSKANGTLIHREKAQKNHSPVQHNPKFLRKQKFTISQRVRNKPMFYNKVVARKSMQRTIDSFFFVINFDSECGTLRLVKLEPRGNFFKGKREGRVKWKAVLNGEKGISSKDRKYDWTVPASDWDVVPSVMVTKTTIVADESWDILEIQPQ